MAVEAVGYAVLAQRQPVGRGVDRDDRLAVMRLEVSRKAGAHQGGADLHQRFNLRRVETLKRVANLRPAASQDILDRGRCNSNAPELASRTHTPHRAVRFALIRSSRADVRAAESFCVTSPPVPKNTSFGVCPWNAEWGITSL